MSYNFILAFPKCIIFLQTSHFAEKSDSGKMFCLMVEILVVSADVLLGVNEAILFSHLIMIIAFDSTSDIISFLSHSRIYTLNSFSSPFLKSFFHKILLKLLLSWRLKYIEKAEYDSLWLKS